MDRIGNHHGVGLVGHDEDEREAWIRARELDATRIGDIRAFSVHRVPDVPWDREVRRDERGTAFHLAGWRELITDTLGHEDRSLVALDDDGSLVGLLPLIRVRSAFLGHYLMSMPFLNAGGPLGPESARATLASAARLDAQTSRADLLELRSRDPVDGLRRSDRKITVRLPLATTVEGTWRALPSKVRSQIRRAQQEAFVTRFGPDQRAAFYALFCRTMRRLGTPVLPLAFFDRVARAFPDEAEFCCVWLGDVPVAAACGFTWRDEFEVTWAASSWEHKRMAPNMLLYWELISHAHARGVRTFDFGRCTPGGGTHAFKRQWKGEDVPLPWAQWSTRDVSAPPTPDGGVLRLASNCWRHLPLAVTNRVGPWIAARLP